MAAGEIRYDGRAILVTGAGRGMGRTHALLLASRGAKIVVADNGVSTDGDNPGAGPAEAVVAEIKAAGGEAVACTADLATEAGSQQAVQMTCDAFGKIDGLLHNATTVAKLAPVDELSAPGLDIVLRINPSAALWLAAAAWPHMARQRYGRILYTTSAGVYGSMNCVSYAAAKAAIIGVARSLAVEGAAHGILVNAIAPSAATRTVTDFLKSDYAEWLIRTMPPEKVSAGAAYLMSEDCTINGEIFALGGGRISRITFAETAGVMNAAGSIEEVRDALPQVMAAKDFFYPRDLDERSATVAAMFGAAVHINEQFN
jgi:NAD(P)-dependent dehydrogenase (short-subunit alcohol dehydrogenase family)